MSLSKIHPANYNLIENPTLHYKLSVGELGPDNPAKASDSIGRVVIHELMNYLSMKRRAIDNDEEVIAYSIEIHFAKVGSFIAAESGKTTVVTEKVRKVKDSSQISKNEKNQNKNNKIGKVNENDKDKSKNNKKTDKIDRTIKTLENILEFYKDKLRTDPKNMFYQTKIEEIKNRILSLKMKKIQEEISHRAFSIVKGNIENIASDLFNGEILDAIA